MEREDPWLAPDKVYHVLFCFSVAILFSTVATFTRYPFIRRHAIRFGSICSLLAGAAKETTTVVVAGLLSSLFTIICSTTTGSTLTTRKYKFVARFHRFMVQEKTQAKPAKIVVKQNGHFHFFSDSCFFMHGVAFD